jgi:hypothetical protein
MEKFAPISAEPFGNAKRSAGGSARMRPSAGQRRRQESVLAACAPNQKVAAKTNQAREWLLRKMRGLKLAFRRLNERITLSSHCWSRQR